MAQDPSDDLTALPRGTRLRVGILLFSALGIALVLVWLLSGGGTEFIRSTISVHTYFHDSGGGLEPGAYAMLNGVRIGRVVNLSLAHTQDPNRAVRVDLEVQRRFLPEIPVDSVAALTATNVIGDSYVNITAGKASQTVTDGAELSGLVATGGGFNPADLVKSLQVTLQRADAILTEIETGNTPVAQFVRGDALYTKVQDQIKGIQSTLNQVAGPRSPANAWLRSDAEYNRIRQQILDVDAQLAKTQRGESRAGRFLNDPSAYDNAVVQIRKVHRSINDLNSEQSAAHAWLVSDERYNQLRTRIASLDHSVNDLTDGKSRFAQLIRDRQLYDSLNARSASTGKFLKEFREEPRKFLRVELKHKKKKAGP